MVDSYITSDQSSSTRVCCALIIRAPYPAKQTHCGKNKALENARDERKVEDGVRAQGGGEDEAREEGEDTGSRPAPNEKQRRQAACYIHLLGNL